MDIFKKKKDDNPQTDNAAPEVDEAAPFKIKLQDGKACEKILTIEIGQDKIRGEYEMYHAIFSQRSGFDRAGHREVWKCTETRE